MRKCSGNTWDGVVNGGVRGRGDVGVGGGGSGVVSRGGGVVRLSE